MDRLGRLVVLGKFAILNFTSIFPIFSVILLQSGDSFIAFMNSSVSLKSASSLLICFGTEVSLSRLLLV